VEDAAVVLAYGVGIAEVTRVEEVNQIKYIILAQHNAFFATRSFSGKHNPPPIVK